MRYLTNIALISLGLALLPSCSAVYEDLDPCPQGVDFRVVYDHNVLSADAFDSANHCATVHIYGESGYYLTSAGFNGNRNLTVDLPAGNYHFLVYDGVDCEDASYVYGHDLSATHHFTDAHTKLAVSRAAAVSADPLHPQYHSAGDVTVEEDATGHTTAEVHMVKNTNNLRVVLQNQDGSDLSPDIFDFSVTADNSTTGHDNNVIPTGDEVTYKPWVTGQVVSGLIFNKEEGATPAHNAFAEISFGRFMADNGPVLHIALAPTEDEEGENLIDVDLAAYINMIKSYEFADTSLQDYLDRQDQFSIVFILDPVTHKWVQTLIKVNDWDIVLNDWILRSDH